MSGDPATIGSTPVDIVVTMVEYPLKRFFGPDVIASGGVANALWFSSRTTGVKNKGGCFAVERRCGAIVAGGVSQFVPPMVTTLFHLNIVVASF